MPAPFAFLQSRVNAAVFKRLANAEALIAGGATPVPGIFDNAYQLAEVGGTGMASVRPVLEVASSAVPASPVGTAVFVNGINYSVADAQPDGTGNVVLFLELAA